MGKHVAVLREGHITAGQGYEDRVFLEDPTASDDFSLVLRDVVFSDGGIYECLWRGQKPVCSVFVDVLESLNFPVLAAVGEDVTLHCFGNVPSNNPWEDIDIHWLKDEREVLRFTSGKIDVNVDNSHMSLPVREEMSRGIFSLNIRSIRAQDQGVYQCRYKSTDHEDLQNGLPETRKLILLDVSSDVPSTSESILSTSSGSYTQTSTSVPTWTSVASTEWSTEISTSAQTSADTVEGI
ncbi:uncharacterized protein LOC130552508 [Triplophysa rosa]|uniref:uncharacterized protein LOC130552508 n=1 Tax=Triplophysa rosa TaxID=992332 RepID=UPI0025461351|nr:uncharacterized protein LOC130552508 [Triplophysa rosa]